MMMMMMMTVGPDAPAPAVILRQRLKADCRVLLQLCRQPFKRAVYSVNSLIHLRCNEIRYIFLTPSIKFCTTKNNDNLSKQNGKTQQNPTTTFAYSASAESRRLRARLTSRGKKTPCAGASRHQAAAGQPTLPLPYTAGERRGGAAKGTNDNLTQRWWPPSASKFHRAAIIFRSKQARTSGRDSSLENLVYEQTEDTYIRQQRGLMTV